MWRGSSPWRPRNDGEDEDGDHVSSRVFNEGVSWVGWAGSGAAAWAACGLRC
jgi:hypothetical protein